MRSYDELYVSDAQSSLGGAFHYAINDCGILPDEFMEEFLRSCLSKEFELGNPWVLSGMSGIELVQRILETTRRDYVFPSPSPVVFKTMEYWAGYYLAYFQWFTGMRFQDIFIRVPLSEIIAMYPVYHEMDVTNFVDDFLNTGGAFVHEYVYSRIVAQSASCRDCVLEMETRRVVFPGYGGNSSLSEIRVALADVRFREQRNFSVFRSLISSV